MDFIEQRGPRTDSHISGDPRGYFDYIPRLNIATGFRYNSKELIDRLIKYHDTNNRWFSNNQTAFQFRSRITKAQLNLGLLDDALESLRKTTCSHEALEMLGDIVFYALINKTLEEASNIETEAIAIFQNVPELRERGSRGMGDYYLVSYYSRMAVRLMDVGEAEKSALYLQKAIDWAEQEQVRQDRQARRTSNMNSQIERVLGAFVTGGYLDKAEELAVQVENRFIMPHLHLRIAERRAEAGEMEQARSALRKAFEQISQFSPWFHPYGYTSFSRKAMLAVKLDDKELFYEIMNAGVKVAEELRWHENGIRSGEPLGFFTRQLAIYGNGDHPLFALAEKAAAGFDGERAEKGNLYFSLGVSRAMLGDHDNARRLLARGIEARAQQRFRSSSTSFLPAIVEAWSYERQ